MDDKKLQGVKRTCSNPIKETKNFEKRFDEMLTRIDNIERNINELTELKNTTQKLSKICTSLNS